MRLQLPYICSDTCEHLDSLSLFCNRFERGRKLTSEHTSHSQHNPTTVRCIMIAIHNAQPLQLRTLRNNIYYNLQLLYYSFLLFEFPFLGWYLITCCSSYTNCSTDTVKRLEQWNSNLKIKWVFQFGKHEYKLNSPEYDCSLNVSLFLDL